jgi:hypothetical protein
MNYFTMKQYTQHTAIQGSGQKTTPFFQPKLTVNTPGDIHEREADAVADQVMRMKTGDAPIVQRMSLTPVSSVQRACANCEKEKEGMQRKETGGGDANGKAAPSIVSNVLSSGGGQPMDGGTRQFMESRFGQDFSQVRIHTDSKAAESASVIQARAYTSGRDVVFGSGEFQPESEGGRRLLAHELVHVGQQAGEVSRTIQRMPSIYSPRREDLVFEEQNGSETGQVQRTSALDQSSPTNHDPNLAYPWRQPGPAGYNYYLTTDKGTAIEGWVALGEPPTLSYWCHGHSLGTYQRWGYSVYSGNDLFLTLRDEYQQIAETNVQQGDIAVWTPSFGHSCRFETVVLNGGE